MKPIILTVQIIIFRILLVLNYSVFYRITEKGNVGSSTKEAVDNKKGA
jgi:hypothetical protein